jgi:DNA-binding response OmpR family regulator
MPASDTKKQILIVDREVATVEPLRQRLADLGFVVRIVTDGSVAATAVKERPPHLIIIDWNIPGFAAIAVIQDLRGLRLPQVIRIIILSTLSSEQDIVAGLNLGADDYIAKPYSLPEVAARVCTLLRSRSSEKHRVSPSCDDLVLDPRMHRVTAHGRPVNLRRVEYRLLEVLMAHQGRALNRTELLARVWGNDYEVDERTVDVNVQRLRKLLTEPGYKGYIQTVRGFGYRFGSPVSAASPTGQSAI